MTRYMTETNRIEYKRELTPELDIENLPESLTKEEFFNGISIPRNKELMRIYREVVGFWHSSYFASIWRRLL